MEINIESGIIIGDEAGQKVYVERQSTTMAGSFAFSLWMWDGFVPVFLGLGKLFPMVERFRICPRDLFCSSHFRNVIHFLGL